MISRFVKYRLGVIKMKVVQVIPEFGIGGAETMCANLTIELHKQGHDVLVVSLYPYQSAITKRIEENQVQIVYLNKKSGIDFSIISALADLMRQFRPDVVHTHLYAGKYAHIAASLVGIQRKVHTIHNIASKDGGKVEQAANYFLFKLLGVIPVSLSTAVQKTVLERYGIPSSKSPIVWNGVPLDRCVPMREYSADAARFVHVGRFTEAKNQKALIRAFLQLHGQYPGIMLNLYGEGEGKPACEELVRQNSAGGYVHFCGVTDDVYSALSQADVFILPSLYEGMPMTLIEAMGTGLPIITTSVGGIVDMLKDGESALFVDTDADSIAQGIMKLAGDSDLRKKLGTAALQRSKDFSVEEMAKKYCEIYSK